MVYARDPIQIECSVCVLLVVLAAARRTRRIAAIGHSPQQSAESVEIDGGRWGGFFGGVLLSRSTTKIENSGSLPRTHRRVESCSGVAMNCIAFQYRQQISPVLPPAAFFSVRLKTSLSFFHSTY